MRDNIRQMILPFLIAVLSLWQFAACRQTNPQVEALLCRSESLMLAHPDSALLLLQKQPNPYKLATSECARYALLLARATDLCGKSLLPCDSLLDVALDYYDGREKERAVALLYKGKQVVELGKRECGIDYLLEGWDIIQEYPEMDEIKKQLLCSLGNEYFHAHLYENAGMIYKRLYQCCSSERDKAVALNRLGSYYTMAGKKDSALVCQHQALKYARASKDSAIVAAVALDLSMEYSLEEKEDTAHHYAKMSLQWLPLNKNGRVYTSNMGRILCDKSMNDSVIHYVDDDAGCDAAGGNAALLTLSAMKEEQGDYKAAIDLLYRFIDTFDTLYMPKQSVEMEKVIHKYEMQAKVQKEHEDGNRRLKDAIVAFIVVCLVLILFFQHHINKRKKRHLINAQKLQQAKDRLVMLQNSIDESQYIITLLEKEKSDVLQERNGLREEMTLREAHIEKLKEEKETLRTWLFQQTDIYKKIMRLSKQEVADDKGLKVLSHAEQIKLQETIKKVYADYIADLQIQYPRLTEDDLLYLCLEKAAFSTRTISLCFGNFNTHALAQRKYRLKERMKTTK